VHAIGFVSEDWAAESSNHAMLCLVRAASLRGIHVGSRHQFEDMNRLINAVQLKPVVDKVFPFENAQDAYDHLQSQAHVGKVVIKVAHD